MRIAIDYTAAVNQQAGIGRFVRCLVNAVTVVDEQDSYVLVHAEPNPGAKPVYPRTGNVAIRRLPLNERALTILWHRLGVTLPVDWFTGPIDLFHSPDFVLPPQRRGKRVLTVHDLAFLLFPECADAGLRQYLEHVVPRSARRADFVLADSENTRNDVICLLGVPEQRVAVVPGGVEQRFRPQTDQQRLKELRDRLGLEDVPFILWLGVVEPRKNVRRLMEAFGLLLQRASSPHRLLLVGRKGWLSDEVFQFAERAPYRDRIQFTGFVEDDDLPTLYSAADLFVFPSLYEGFGLPVLEAMACGTPVVCASAASLPEVAGDAALLVEPTEVEALSVAMERALTDASLRASLRQRGLEQAARFTWDAAARKLVRVYQGVVQGTI
jgi:glycosyltransferase involved in cell wall biosynthesis